MQTVEDRGDSSHFNVGGCHAGVQRHGLRGVEIYGEPGGRTVKETVQVWRGARESRLRDRLKPWSDLVLTCVLSDPITSGQV